MEYNHTQTGHLMLAALVFVIAIFWITLSLAEFNPIAVSVMVLAVFILVSFATLNVRVDKGFLKIKFGWGIFRKSFKIGEVSSAKRVRNKWYYGWGIRYNPWLRLWIFNVSGFDAVELIMKNGKKYRIGTDEPEKLERAIKMNLRAQ